MKKIDKVDAVIATGSDNTSRYFEFNFSGLPVLIRKNRSSCAILKGNETELDYFNLGKDLFHYYGLGCRNISKIYIPKNFELTKLIGSLTDYKDVMELTEYADNYLYNKAIYKMDQVPIKDNGFLLIKEDEKIVSPIGVLFFERYENDKALAKKLEMEKDQIQCLVSKNAWFPNTIQFGSAQQPELWDYADGRDTMEFILGLN